MCYHYSIAKTADIIAESYNLPLRLPKINPEPVCFHANGFMFPLLPVIYKSSTNSSIKLEFMKWGLIPAWVKEHEQVHKIRSMTLNARADTVNSKPSYRSAFRNRPCLVPATGYFEWMHHKGKKYPFQIYLPEKKVFSFAGIWEEWISNQTGEIVRSYSIITCEANTLAAKIHNTKKRMPVILDEQSEKVWLDIKSGIKDRISVLKPFDTGKMAAYSVGRLITSRTQNSDVPEVLEAFNYAELN